MSARHRVVILASGSGSTAEAFVHATQDGRVDADVVSLVCNNTPDKAGIHGRIDRLNKQYGLKIEKVVINSRTHPDGAEGRGQTLAESAAICDLAKGVKADLILLLGYMKVVRGDLIDEYGWHGGMKSVYEARILNTHPGPLPETTDTFGVHASQKVLDLGMDTSRHTVHVVAGGVDEGPVVVAHPVEVRDDDTAETLFDRVQTVEKAALPYAVDRFLREQREYLGSKSK